MKNYYSENLKKFEDTNLDIMDTYLAFCVNHHIWMNNELSHKLEKGVEFDVKLFETICKFVSQYVDSIETNVDIRDILDIIDIAVDNDDITIKEIKSIFRNRKNYSKLTNICYMRILW